MPGPGGVLLGYGLFFVTHSIRWGPSLYLEDLYVAPPHRGRDPGFWVTPPPSPRGGDTPIYGGVCVSQRERHRVPAAE